MNYLNMKFHYLQSQLQSMGLGQIFWFLVQLMAIFAGKMPDDIFNLRNDDLGSTEYGKTHANKQRDGDRISGHFAAHTDRCIGLFSNIDHFFN